MTDLVPAPVPAPRVAWPTTPRAFADTSLCPRCFAVLPSSRCDACGLELGVPLAAHVIIASNELVDAERRRRELIDRMWSEQVAAQAEAQSHAETVAQGRPIAQPAPAWVPDATVVAAASAPVLPAATPPFPPSGADRSAAPAAPRRSGVQVFLLVTGIVLLSVFALFFLTVAYLFATVEVRVLVTALAGLVVFGVAWMLARRGLPATGEGVGVAGAAILLGTLGFIRGAELFGSATVDPTLFLGAGLIVVAGLLAALHRASALRFARIGSLLLAPTGVALLVIGVLNPLDAGLAWWAGLLAAGASTMLVRHPEEPGVEPALVRSIGFGAVAAALIPSALLLPGLPGSSVVAYSVAALAWGAFVLRLRREPGTAAWSSTASALLGLSVSLAPAVAILRDAPIEWNLWAPGAAACVVATAFVMLAHTSSNPATKQTLTWAQGPALVVAAVATLPGVGFALVHVLSSLIPRYRVWEALPGDPVDVVPGIGVWAAVLAPGIAALLAALAIRLVRLPAATRAGAAGLAAVAVLAAASHGGSVLIVFIGYLLVSVAGLAVLLFTRRRLDLAAQVPAAVALGIATLAILVISHASAGLWLPSVLAAVCLIVAARYAVASDGPGSRIARAVLTAVAVALVFAEATLLTPWLSGLRTGVFGLDVVAASPIDFVGIPGTISVLLLCVAPFVVGRRTSDLARGAGDLRAAAIVALPVAILSCVVALSTTAASSRDHVVRIVIPILLAIAGALWQRRASTAMFVERVVLASVAPVAAAAALAAVAVAVDPSSGPLGDYLAGPVAAIVSAAAGVLIFGRATSGLPGAARIAWQSATGLVVAVAVVHALASAGDGTWAILLLLAAAPLIVAFGGGNPFTSPAPRRYFLVPFCILAVAALWQFLAFRGVSEVEPYTLPVAGLLLCIAAASAVFGHRSAAAVAGRSILFAAGLVVALGPSALVATTESSVRTVAVLVIAAALVAAALFSPRVVHGILVRDSGLILALVALAGVGLAGAARDAVDRDVLVPELWVLPAALALAAISIVWTRRRALPFRVAQLGVPSAIALVGLASLVCLVALPDTQVSARLAVVSILLAAVAIGSAVHRRVPLDRVSQYTALSVLVAVAITGLATSAADPFELATAPLAFALIASGVVTLRRYPAARTWPNLGPGVAVLLVPSLLADFGSTELWRVVALGVVSIAIVVAAIALRWQAPLVVGAVVVIVHTLAQSWPWIQGLYSAVPWWIWLGVGGVVLIVVAARYEHRVRNLRSFVGSITALR